ncbi:MFS transporter [Streptomyces sulphureus]|uniref:MFS transporter n=1 Tax=Streptomyces sulphureus TaxID=47758 RepID=UPI000368104D|nr:MFS transporter [Streptomyces sulphureus]
MHKHEIPAEGAEATGETASAPSARMIRRATMAGAVGTVMEWYDYALYGAASALFIGPLFFPGASSAGGALAAFATFAVGFFARPFGGVFISHYGDRIGRKPTLVATIVLMGASTVLMGLLPTYSTAGVLAPILLVLLRLLQGIGAGAELAGATTMVAEYVPARRRGFHTSIPNAATAVGLLLATLAFLAVESLPDGTAMSWGWRLPFLGSILIFAVAMVIRSSLDETPAFAEQQRSGDSAAGQGTKSSKAPVAQLFRSQPRETTLAFLTITGHNANAYVLNTFALSYITKTLEMSETVGLVALVLASVTAVVATPLFGALTDRIGRIKVFALGAAFVACVAFPFFALLDTREPWVVCLTMMAGYGIGFGAMAGAQGAYLAELFDTRYRFTGIAVAREANGVLIAGPTPFVASALVAATGGRPWLVACYLAVCALITLVALWLSARSKAGDRRAQSARYPGGSARPDGPDPAERPHGAAATDGASARTRTPEEY